MLNLGLLYFILLGFYYLGRKYLPKVHELIQFSSQMMKHNPLFITTTLLICLMLVHPEKDLLNNKFLSSDFAQEAVSQLPEAFQEFFEGSDQEIFLYRILTLLLAA